MKIAGDVLDAWSMSSESLLDGVAYHLPKAIVTIDLLQVLIELRSQHVEQLCIVRNKRQLRIARPEDDRVVRGACHDWTSEIAFQCLDMGPRLYKLDTQL
jgi:hypothetical protein